MAYVNLALHISEVLLLSVIAVMVLQNHSKMEWLRAVLIPFLSSLSRVVNPEKK